jgi:hypothetical protein
MRNKPILRLPYILGILLFAGLMVGCSKNSTGPSSSDAPVSMAISFSKAGTPGLMKGYSIETVDSLRIDSAVVILSRIKFVSHVDTVAVDTTEGGPDDLDRDQSIAFKGPFVIHVRDTVAINFASQVLPAGTYDGIKFKIHRLQNGEAHEDSDDRNNHPRMSDSSIIGSSVTVWGAIKKNGTWTSFTFNFNGEIEFKIKGTFTVSSSTSTVKLALNFNMGSWFINPQTQTLLDPTDRSQTNFEQIRRAIYASFGKGRGGHDRGDGHPDN